MKRFFDRYAERILAGAAALVLGTSLVIGTARAATPVVGAEVGVGLVCKSQEPAVAVAEVTAQSRNYGNGAALARMTGQCGVLPQAVAVRPTKVAAVGQRFTDGDGDMVQLHVVEFDADGVTYWGVVIEILPGA